MGKGAQLRGASPVKFPRRQFLHLAASAAALSAASRLTWAQAYPTRPVRLIVPFTPGGTTDIVARLLGQSLSERLGQPMVIENRPGAGTNVGTEAVVNSPPDGYTLLVASSAAAINATLYEKLNFNFDRDIAVVAGVIRTPYVMEVTHRFQPRLCLSLSGTQKPIRAKSTWPPPASGPALICRGNCSS